MTSESSPAGTRLVDGSYSWFRLAVCVTLGSVGSVGMWSVVIILPVIQAEFAVDRGTASIPYTLTMVGFALGNVIAGRFVDRWGIMIPMIFAGLALGLGFILAASTTALWQFALIQGILVGLGTAVTFGPLISN
ncbi:MAG: MFS transporter, partial [Rhodospirillales bacterium]|nr:MFS transporter [Rhodospirillales bacterium]